MERWLFTLDDDHVKRYFLKKLLNHVLEIKEREEKMKKYIQSKG